MDANDYQSLVEKKDLATLVGYETLRDLLLPELLGDNPDILYWAGKKLAREFNLAKDEDLPIFFHQAGWGTLERLKAHQQKQLFKVSGPIVALRLKKNAEFQLEAGFLAETIQNQLGFVVEAIIKNQDLRHGSVTILVQQDPEDPIDLALIPNKSTLHLTENEVQN